MSDDKRFKDSDLTILPPQKNKAPVKIKRPLDPRMPNLERGILMVLVAMPGHGKTNLLLNLFAREAFAKNYYEKIRFIAAAPDPTLQPLYDYYGQPASDCSDGTINGLIQEQLNEREDDETGYPGTNMAIVIDDALSMKSFSSNKESVLSKLAGIHRHVLRGHLPHEGKSGGGGLMVVSSQRYMGSIPRNIRACADVIIVGKLANKQEFQEVIKEYAEQFGGEDNMRGMVNYVHTTPHSFLCLYLSGDHGEPGVNKAYKNMNELLYPTPRFPAREYTI